MNLENYLEGKNDILYGFIQTYFVENNFASPEVLSIDSDYFESESPEILRNFVKENKIENPIFERSYITYTYNTAFVFHLKIYSIKNYYLIDSDIDSVIPQRIDGKVKLKTLERNCNVLRILTEVKGDKVIITTDEEY